MAIASGTATHQNDLLDKLRIFLVANGWTQNRWVAGALATDIAELAVEAPGSVGGQPVNVSFKTINDPSLNAYAWKVCGAQTFDAGQAFGFQPFNSPQHFFLLWPNAIDYRFYCNDRRVIVVAKIGVVYISLYAGFFLPFCLPTEYPYPFYIGATSSDLAVYSINNARYRSFADPGNGAASYLTREGMNWQTFNNHGDASLLADNPWGSEYVTWPYRVPRSDNEQVIQDFTYGMMNLLRPNASGNTPMFQVLLIDNDARALVGMLDGVFATSGFNRAPEQIVTHSGVDYRLFVNMARTRPKDFFAVEEA